MNYKQKYKEALARAKEMCALPTDKATMEYIFPELAESEDERIRKGLIKAFGTIGKKDWGGLVVGDILDWLEKQGEQTHVELGQSAVTKKSDQELESKKLDADKVIEWIKNYASLFAANWAILDDIIEQFKKDFGL